MTELGNDATLILAFVRGERSWQELESCGVSVQWHPNGLRMIIPGDIKVVTPKRCDVIIGFRRHLADQDSLSQWAAVLSAADFIDLGQFDNDKDQIILDGLGAAAAHEPLGRELIDLFSADCVHET